MHFFLLQSYFCVFLYIKLKRCVENGKYKNGEDVNEDELIILKMEKMQTENIRFLLQSIMFFSFYILDSLEYKCYI